MSELQPKVPDTFEGYTEDEKQLARLKQLEVADAKRKKRNKLIASVAGGSALVAAIAGGAAVALGGGEKTPAPKSPTETSAPVTPGEDPTTEPSAETSATPAAEYGIGIPNQTLEHLNVLASPDVEAEAMQPVLEKDYKTPREAFNRLGLLLNARLLGGENKSSDGVVFGEETPESLVERDKLDSFLLDPEGGPYQMDDENGQRVLLRMILESGVDIYPAFKDPGTYNTLWEATGQVTDLGNGRYQMPITLTRTSNLGIMSPDLFKEKLQLDTDTEVSEGTAEVVLRDGQWFLSKWHYEAAD